MSGPILSLSIAMFFSWRVRDNYKSPFKEVLLNIAICCSREKFWPLTASARTCTLTMISEFISLLSRFVIVSFWKIIMFLYPPLDWLLAFLFFYSFLARNCFLIRPQNVLVSFSSLIEDISYHACLVFRCTSMCTP